MLCSHVWRGTRRASSSLSDWLLIPTPLSHLLPQLIGLAPEKHWSHLFWVTKAWNSLFRSTGKVSWTSCETAKSLSAFTGVRGVVNVTALMVFFYPPSLSFSSFLDVLKHRFMGNLWSPGSSEVYGWAIKLLLLVQKPPNSSPLFQPIPLIHPLPWEPSKKKYML